MSNITYIYNIQNQKDIKLLDSLNYTLEEFKDNPLGCYPTWDIKTMYATDTKFNRPILIEGAIREMTKLEICQSGDLSVLIDGEVFEDNQIKVIPKPQGLNVVWEYPQWIEKSTPEEVKKAYCDLIIGYQNTVMEAGFLWTHQHDDGITKTHIQRARDTDILKLETAISTLADARMIAEKKKQVPMITKFPWHFDDLGEDICPLIEDELRELRIIGGGVFGTAVYETCGILKNQEPKLDLSLKDFLNELSKHTTISALLKND